MGATRRISIAWGDEMHHEPTDTLVLTSPGGHYVDIRLNKSTGDLDWGFCGRAQAHGSTTEYTHEIDSLGFEDPDKGVFSRLANNDLREEGEMLNPATNRLEPYVEIWRPQSVAMDNVRVLCSSRGKIVRVDNWLQGVWKEGEVVRHVRAELRDGEWLLTSGTPIDFGLLDGQSSEWKTIE